MLFNSQGVYIVLVSMLKILEATHLCSWMNPFQQNSIPAGLQHLEIL